MSEICARLRFHSAAVALAIVLSTVDAEGGLAPGCTVTLDLPNAVHQANSVAIQHDGKIVVAGYADFGLGLGRDLLVARFHPDLTLDPTFNGTGYRVSDLQTRDDEALGVAITSDQKIVVAGYSQKSAGQYWFAFARFNGDGTWDTSFNGGGLSLIDFTGSADDRMLAVSLQPDGKVVGAGFVSPSGVRQLAVVRLNKDGNLDLTFDTDGAAAPTLSGSSYSFGTDVLVDSNGKIVASGEGGFATSDFLAVRLNPNGSLDTTFNGTGWRSTNIAAGDSAQSLVRQPDGGLVLGGNSSGNFALVRYTANGALDPTFNGTGIAVHDFGGTDVGRDVALDGAGNIVVAGESSLNFAFARFLPGGPLDLSKIDDVSGSNDGAYSLAITRPGKILLAGSGLFGGSLKATLSLYNPDGTQDCGAFFLHPTAYAGSDFTAAGCSLNEDCVNDQPANAATGPPAPEDGAVTMVVSTGAPARDLYELADGLLPAGKVVTEVEIVAELAWSGTGSAPSAQLLYQRQGFDAAPVSGSLLTVSNTVFLQFRQRFSSLNWSSAELDALEIGLDHLGGNNLWMTRLYLQATFGENLARPVEVLTAAASGDSASGRVMLNWLNPSYGLYDETIVRRVPACPALPTDGVLVASAADGLGQAGSFVDSPPLGTTYFYAAFVEDAEDRPSAVKCVSATPFDRTVGKVEWVYDTAISALTTPGLRLDVPLSQSVVYSVANDGVVHAIRGGSVAGGGGAWPSGWAPFRIGGSAQSRPPVVSLPPSSRRAVILGSQDGHAYAVDALTGELIWKSFRLGTTIQAAPAVALSALGGVKDLVFIGTRDPGQPNRLYALNAADGTVAWFFDNGGVLPIGIIVSGPTVDYGGKRVYFTSAKGTSGKTVWCLDYNAPTPPGTCWGVGFGVATPGGGDVETSPILFQGSVLVSENAASGDLYAINPADGSQLLLFSLFDGGAKGYVFPRFSTFDVFASTATTTWSIDTSPPASANWQVSCIANPSTPTWVPGTDWAFVGSNEGKLFQLSAAFSACPISTSACIGDCLSTIVGAPAYDVLKSMLYSGTDEGKVYGVRAPF